MVLKFIEPEQTTPPKEQCQPVSYIRKQFTVKEKPVKAVLYMTALGVYEPSVNGKKVTEELLRPGFTNYNARLQYQSYNVTDIINAGENVIGVLLADGWYRGCLGVANDRCVYGEKVKLAAKLEIEYSDGSTEKLETDSSWKTTKNGPYRLADMKTDEYYDSSLEQYIEGWETPGFDDSGWQNCMSAVYEGELLPQEGNPLLVHETLPGKIITTPNGEKIIDFGQNHSGMIEFTVTGAAGSKVILTLGECLDEEGNFTTKNLIPQGTKDAKNKVGQRITYVLREGKQSYRTRFLVSGFRYAKPEYWPQELLAENFVSHAVYSDLRPTGKFICSTDQINQLYSNIIWSMKSNFVDIPTDCPQRERAGWTGDINVFSETANFIADSKSFLKKWLHDFLSLQRKDGNLPFIVPEVPMGEICCGSAGWSDALLNVAMVLYQFYGDTDIIAEVYEAAKRFIDFNLKRAARKNIFHLFKYKEYYQYILDTGYHYGEWMEPGKSLMTEGIKGLLAPDAEVATAWLYHSTVQLSEMAKLLGKDKECEYYSTVAKKIREAYRKEFTKNGQIVSDRQCKYVRPIYMGLLDETEKRSAAAQLDAMCRTNQYRVGTGFLTTYQLLQVLCDYGFKETAYRILENQECPGWIYEISKGATTTWENWMGIDEKGVPQDSHNHYAPGAVAAWFYTHVGGIRPLAPGFSKVQIKPFPGGSLTWANVSYESCKGRIVSDWKIEDDKFKIKIKLPEEIEGTIILPDGKMEKVHGGNHEFTCKIGEKRNGKEREKKERSK